MAVLVAIVAILLFLLIGGLKGAFAFAAVVLLYTRWNARRTLTGFDRLQKLGVPARGILLEVKPTALSSTPVMRGLGRVEMRSMRLDVEIDGRAPYEVSTVVMVPSNMARDALPGAIVELRVDPKAQGNVAIVGPGIGFSGGPLTGPPPTRGAPAAARR